MRKILSIAIFASVLLTAPCFAMLSLELTQGVAGAVPIAISPFRTEGQPPQDVTAIIRNDLQNSGRFHVEGSSASVENSVTGQVTGLGNDQYQVSFALRDNLKSSVKAKHAQQTQQQTSIVLTKTFTVKGEQLRLLAHHISDLIYQQIIGVRGIFSTRLAYVLVQQPATGPTKYALEVADQDGYNPRPLLTSTDPIMSPAWSPTGKKIAYVSFENNHASIYIEEVATGARQLVSEFPGINGAPAWSPDGRKLALVLSKSGSPNIYILDIATKQLTQLTHDFYVNTEPAWSHDGKTIIFTSTRSGGPQIYQMNLASRAVSRLSYDGDYNARASFVPSNNGIVMINRDSGWYNIGILDLDTGKFRTLTSSSKSDSDSPSVAPNGSMVLYDTVYNGRSVLAMVASDGSIQIRLPARDGQAQDPAWSPYLS